MREEHEKAVIVQWLVPLGVLVTVIGVMLINFSLTSTRTEKKEVENGLVTTAEGYAIKFYNRLEYMTRSGIPMGAMMEKHSSQDIGNAESVVKVLYDNTDAYAVALCNPEGEGIDHTRTRINLSQTSYFSEMNKAKQAYYYTEDDGWIGKRAIVSAIPLKTENVIQSYLLLYYDADTFGNLTKKIEFDTLAFYAVVDMEGSVIGAAGNLEGSYFQGDNFWTDLSKGEDKNLTKAQERMKNNLSGVAYVNTTEGEKSIVYAPVGINDWYMIIGINKSHTDMLLAEEWSVNKNMVLKLIIAICIFFGMIIIINIIVKIRDNEQSKSLADKADTDQLTELTNKVATERLIKEYIAAYPNEQAVLFILDIDNFKKINDTMGHAFGDEVLRTLGIRLRAEFRVSDIIGRTGGDEFMILLKNLKTDGLIATEVKRLEQFFHNFQAGEYVKYSVTASIGAAVYPKDAEDFQGLYKAADHAMYIAKRRGKNQLAFYGEEE